METIFINTENSKKMSLATLFTSLLKNLIAKTQITKTLDWLI